MDPELSKIIALVIIMVVPLFLFLLFFALPEILEKYDNYNKREFEIKKLQIKTSRINIVAPLAVSLIKEITNNSAQIPDETSKELISVLNKILEIIRVEPANQSKLEEPINDLTELIDKGNLSLDLVLKLQQLRDSITIN